MNADAASCRQATFTGDEPWDAMELRVRRWLFAGPGKFRSRRWEDGAAVRRAPYPDGQGCV